MIFIRIFAVQHVFQDYDDGAEGASEGARWTGPPPPPARHKRCRGGGNLWHRSTWLASVSVAPGGGKSGFSFFVYTFSSGHLFVTWFFRILDFQDFRFSAWKFDVGDHCYAGFLVFGMVRQDFFSVQGCLFLRIFGFATWLLSSFEIQDRFFSKVLFLVDFRIFDGVVEGTDGAR